MTDHTSIRLSRAQSRAVDHIAAEKYHLPTIVLMENAARAAADLAEKMVNKSSARIAILSGPGNNGGDGLAMARHLHNHGHAVQIFLLDDPAKYKGDALINWQIIEAMKIPHSPLSPRSGVDADLIVDALFGTGIIEPPRPPFAEIATMVNAAGIPILAVDIPSALDGDTGRPLGSVAIRADQTITFVAEKTGFAAVTAKEYLGKVTVGDIGCPQACINEALAG